MDTGQIPLQGRRLSDRYVLEEELASGGMGGLWLARDEVLGRQVAVKVLHDHLASDEQLLERFRMEAVAAARLSHPAVVRVFDTGVDEEVCFIVMELVEGRSVADLLSERGYLRPEEAARIGRAVLQALAHAHRESVIHRDVKPGNILIGRDAIVKLADFGIAKTAFAGGDLTTTGNLLGTSRYLSPEQVTGGELDARSDIYSVGVVLYELLTGRPPFDAETHIATATMRLTVDPPPPGSLRPGIPRALEGVVMRALAREPEDRFQAADEMSAALAHAVPTDEAPRTVAMEVQPVAPRRSLRSWIVVPLVLLLLAGLTVGAFLLLEGFGNDRDPSRNAPRRTARPLEINDAYSYDPEAGDGENEDELDNAIDGDSDTEWTTEGYFSPDVGGKEGVGLVLELAEDSEIGGLAIETDLVGWEFSVYAGDEPNSFDRTAALGGPFEAESTTYEIDPVETSYLLVWITKVVDSNDGKWRAVVNEIDVLSPDG